MKVLITGASGFLGQAIVREFSGGGFEVFTTARRQIGSSGSKTHFQVDVTDRESIGKLLRLEKLNAVIHVAGLAHQFGQTNGKMFRLVNVEGTRHVAELAIQLKAEHFVLVSTVAVYGNSGFKQINTSPIDENRICRPKGVYARSKYEAEQTAREICRKNQLKLTVLRPATIVGEGDAGNTRRLIEIIDKNRFVWIGNGENLKSLIYKDDAARACRRVVTAMTPDRDFEKIYNVTGEPLKMREIVDEIAAALGRTIPKISINGSLVIKTLEAAERITRLKKIGRISATIAKWMSEEKFSGERLRSDLGFESRVAIREAIKREVDFYKSTN